jgi:hypothetical protein
MGKYMIQQRAKIAVFSNSRNLALWAYTVAREIT